jgi:hypothetical protein
MAALPPDQCTQVWTEGSCGKTSLYSMKNVTAGDTVDLSGAFKYVKRAGIVSDTGTTIGACTIQAPTGLTIPAGPANDGVWLLVAGISV